MSKKCYRWILIIFDGRNKTIFNIDLLKTTRGSVRTLSNQRDEMTINNFKEHPKNS